MPEPWLVDVEDGGTIAVWVEGQGSPIVLVHGSMTDHRSFELLVDQLREHFTTYAMDRRGFGASPEGPDYSAEREFGDVARVVREVARRTGEPVALFGHSWGASCALGAAAPDTTDLRALVLYEPSLGLHYPPGYIDRVETRVGAGDYEGAVVQVLVELGGMTEEQVVAVRAAPAWPDRVAAAPTIAREAHIEDSWVLSPEQFDGIDVPTLLLAGSRTTPDLAELARRTAAAVPGAQLRVLEGFDHFAPRLEPAVVAEAMVQWLD